MKYDCIFLSMSFLNEDIPKDKKFLIHYFKGNAQSAFLRYLIFFGDYKNFRDHAGYACQDRWLDKLFSKYVDLIYVYDILKKRIELDALDQINSGKTKIYCKNKSNYIIKNTI